MFCLGFSNTGCLCSGWQHQAKRFKSECVIFGDQRSRFLEILFRVPGAVSGKYKHNFTELQPRMKMRELSTITIQK